MHFAFDEFGDIRDGVRAVCADFPDEYHRKVDHDRAYPEAFVDALTKAGWMAALIPEEYGGSGLSLTAASVIMEEINRAGGNSGACHGSPSGKGMFRLSLRGFDQKLDLLTLIREDFGRRVNRIEPENSLLLQKPLMKVSHGGGKQIHSDDPAYHIIRKWIAEGANADPPDAPRCVRLEVYPAQKRIMALEHARQQLSVLAHFSDGSSRDVTKLVVYESSDQSIAAVDESILYLTNTAYPQFSKSSGR